METNVVIVLIWCAVVFAIHELSCRMYNRMTTGTETLKTFLDKSEETGFGKALRTRLGNIVINTILTVNVIFPIFALIGIFDFGAVIWWASMNLIFFSFYLLVIVWLSDAANRFEAEERYDTSTFLTEARKIEAEAKDLIERKKKRLELEREGQ